MQGELKPDLIGAPPIDLSKGIFYAKFNLQAKKNPADMKINCTFETISRTNTGVITQPEYDSVVFPIVFNESHFGRINDSLKKKVKAVKDSPLVKGEWITKVQRISDFLTGLCNTWKLVEKTGETLNSVGVVLGVLGYVPVVGPFVKPLADGFSKVGTTITDFATKTAKVIGEGCAYVSCSKVPVESVKNAIENLQGGQIPFTGGKVILGKCLDFRRN